MVGYPEAGPQTRPISVAQTLAVNASQVDVGRPRASSAADWLRLRPRHGTGVAS